MDMIYHRPFHDWLHINGPTSTNSIASDDERSDNGDGDRS
jgi:hypothetical protein